LLDRLEDPLTGNMPEAFNVNIPVDKYESLLNTCEIKKDELINKFPYYGKMEPTTKDPVRAMINRTWKP